MRNKITIFVGRILVGFGAIGFLAMIIASWGAFSRFSEICYRAAEAKVIARQDHVVKIGSSSPNARSASQVSESRRVELGGAQVLDVSGLIPIDDLPDQKLTDEMRGANPSQDSRFSILAAVSIPISLALFGLILLAPIRFRGLRYFPIFVGLVPLVGYAISHFYFFLLFQRPLNVLRAAYQSGYYVDGISFDEPVFVLYISLVVGSVLATLVWSAQAFYSQSRDASDLS